MELVEDSCACPITMNILPFSLCFGPSVPGNTSGQNQDPKSFQTLLVLIPPPIESSAGSRLVAPWQQCCCNQRQTASALRPGGERGGDCLQRRPTSALHLPPVRDRAFNSFSTSRIQGSFFHCVFCHERIKLCFSICGRSAK